jgi:hypothetical protein
MVQRFLRKVYNRGDYPQILIPQELADLMTDYVYLEETDGKILIRPTVIIPK